MLVYVLVDLPGALQQQTAAHHAAQVLREEGENGRAELHVRQNDLLLETFDKGIGASFVFVAIATSSSEDHAADGVQPSGVGGATLLQVYEHRLGRLHLVQFVRNDAVLKVEEGTVINCL